MKIVKKLVLFWLMFSLTLAIPTYIPQHHMLGKILLPMHLTVLLSGYIVGGVHSLPGDMSQAHLKAMIDAYRDARDY